MATEKHPVKQESKDAIDVDMKLERVPPVSSCKVEGQEDEYWDNVPGVRFDFSNEWD